MLTITLQSAENLTAEEVTALCELAQRTGFPLEKSYLKTAHFAHNPTIVMAHQNDRLVGFQAYNMYRLKTPFFRHPVPFIYGGLAFQDATVAGRGVGYRISRYYMQQSLGKWFFLKNYAFAIRTPTPRLIQIMSVQHKLAHFKNGRITPEVFQFAQHFIKNVRRFQDPIDERLIVHGKPVYADITDQWPTLFRASNEYFNQLAYEAGLIEATENRKFITGKYLFLLGHSSLGQLFRANIS